MQQTPRQELHPELGISPQEWFKLESLKCMAESLRRVTYKGYPELNDRLWYDGDWRPVGQIALPLGKWETSGGEVPTIQEQQFFAQQAMWSDTYSRPLHPWLEEMIENPSIGIVTGKGAYWHWGPNFTADPIVIRRDLSEPHVLLIDRTDDTGWALPGGFIDQNETDIDAAVREAEEETGVDITQLQHSTKPVYKGLLADLRTTANAWPETAAFCFELDLNSPAEAKKLEAMTKQKTVAKATGSLAITMSWKGSDDAKTAAWVPISALGDNLFGSHRLLIDLALK